MSLDNFLYSSSAEDLDYPNIRPTLDLNFIRNQKVPPFVNVTRNSQTTYVDKFGILRTADINQPVFEWDPITGKCLGARIWGVVTNLIQWSESFDNAIWIKLVGGTGSTPVVTENYAISPAGTMTASRLVANRGSSNTTNDQSVIQQAIGSLSSVSHTTTNSVWMRSNTGQSQIVYFRNATGAGGSLQTVTNQWQRFSVTGTRTGNTANNIQIGTRGAQGSDQSIDILIYGGQIQLSDTLGPYVPTTTAAASSTADMWSITGADFNRIWNQSEATVYAEAASALATDSTIWQVDDNTGNSNRFTQYLAPNLLRSRTTISNTQNDIDFVGAAANVSYRGAYGIKESDYAASFNGSIQISSHKMPSATMSILRIGSVHPGSAVMLNGYIRRLTIYPKRLTNSQLKALTR